MTYRPRYVTQFDGSRYASGNCVAASAAMDLDRDTRGRERTSGAKVRSLTGDTSGGLTLEQADIALRRGWPDRDHLDVRPRVSWSDTTAAIRRGQGALLLGSYAVLADAGYDGSPGFRDNHAIWVNEISGMMALKYDPLCDHRRAGIPQDPTWVPLDVLRRFAGLLVVDELGTRLGLGSAQVGLSRDTEPLYQVVVSAGRFFRYFLNADRQITHREAHHTGGFSAHVSSPVLCAWESGTANPRSLVQVTTRASAYYGWYVQPGSTNVKLRAIP